jgi:hypothetical protein
MDHTFFVIQLLLAVIIYMLPTMIAYARDIPARHNIMLANIILGWTVIGWFVAFLWAMMAETQAEEPT